MKRSLIFFSILAFSTTLFLVSCEKVEPDGSDNNTNETNAFGWFGEDDVSEVPTTTNYGFGNPDFPSSVDLTSKFPPIGDQNPYGTCVAWAVAYNAKTAVNGMANGYGPSDLASPNKQFSPKDFFTSLPDGDKGDNCNGTNFVTALDHLQSRGVATMQTVPYTDLNGCYQANTQSSWTSEAANNKIKYYRRIDPTVATIKENLANDSPVVLGAKLADNFMAWNTDDVISYNTTYDQVGQHAYHALVIAGYDDNKGPNGAFRVINSWNTTWGDQGYIWVDYGFMMDEFCANLNGGYALFVMANEDGNTTPPDPDPTNSGVDLVPWVFSDVSTDIWTAERQLEFNIYNVGNEAANPEADWSYVYLYYNAFDADDYGLIVYDQFNTTIPANTYDCPTDYNCVFNFPIGPGEDFGNLMFGNESNLLRTYYMPDISGFYYLLLAVDAGDVFQEQNEMDNLFYTTDDPVVFVNGIILKSEHASPSESTVFNFRNQLSFDPSSRNSTEQYSTAVNQQNRNAYTPEEIMDLLKRKKHSGELDLKVADWQNK